jgi:hypothetical protein
MLQEIGDHQIVWHCGNFGNSTLPWECVLDCSGQGQVDETVAYWERHPLVDLPDSAAILRDLQEAGAWDDLDESEEPDQFEQEKRNRQRYLWMAACDLREDWNAGSPIDLYNPEGIY